MNRINNGEDFQTIAKEMSQDSDTNTKGGDMGWVPMEALDSSLQGTAAGLEIGKVSYPVQTSTATQSASSSSDGTNDQPYYLLMVTEKASNRLIDPQYSRVF
jgi:peptidyl-prolyl cis-trans isomerase SurA